MLRLGTSFKRSETDLSAQAIVDRLGPWITVEAVGEALNRLQASGKYDQVIYDVDLGAE